MPDNTEQPTDEIIRREASGDLILEIAGAQGMPSEDQINLHLRPLWQEIADSFGGDTMRAALYLVEQTVEAIAVEVVCIDPVSDMLDVVPFDLDTNEEPPARPSLTEHLQHEYEEAKRLVDVYSDKGLLAKTYRDYQICLEQMNYYKGRRIAYSDALDYLAK